MLEAAYIKTQRIMDAQASVREFLVKEAYEVVVISYSFSRLRKKIHRFNKVVDITPDGIELTAYHNSHKNNAYILDNVPFRDFVEMYKLFSEHCELLETTELFSSYDRT
jgi:hypothetical protein